MDFEAVETAARCQVLALVARAIAQRLNAGTSDHAGPSLDCACGQAARYAGRRRKVFQSILGGYHFQDMILRTIVSTDPWANSGWIGPTIIARIAAADSIHATGIRESRRPAFLPPPSASLEQSVRWSVFRKAASCCGNWPASALTPVGWSAAPRRSVTKSPPMSGSTAGLTGGRRRMQTLGTRPIINIQS